MKRRFGSAKIGVYCLSACLSWHLTCNKAFTAPTGEDAREDGKVAAALAEGYLSNRAAFKFATATFTITLGRASTQDDAFAGKMTVTDRQAGRWVFDGQKELCSLIRDEKLAVQDKERTKNTEASATAGTMGVTPTGRSTSRYFMGDESRQVSYSPDARMANISGEENRALDSLITPWNMGVMGQGERRSPGKLMLEFVKEEKDIKLLGNRDVRGVAAIAVALKDTEGATMSYCISPTRGFLPVRIEFIGNFDLYITDVRHCEGIGYFPMRSVELTPRVSTGDFFVREIVTTELNVTTHPDDGEFSIDIAEGTRVVNLAKKNDKFVVTKMQSVKLNRLDELVPVRNEVNVERRTTNARSTNVNIVLILGNVVLIVCFCVWFYASRKTRSSTKVS